MHAVLQQVPALIGVLVGAFTSYVVAAAGESARWRRTQSVRWDETRLRTYLEYSSAVKPMPGR